MSAESGIPTFRGQGGFWREFRAEELATAEAFQRNPRLVWESYMWRRDLVSKAAPNPGHFALATLERAFDSFTVVTQNVDGLHRRAGSENLIEIHGNIMRSRCHDCGMLTETTGLGEHRLPPSCASCGGPVRPDVVWFGELLPRMALESALEAATKAQVFLSVGTSSSVQPVSGLLGVAKKAGAFLLEINTEVTELSDQFDETLRGPSGEILPIICQELGLNISSPLAIAN